MAEMFHECPGVDIHGRNVAPYVEREWGIRLTALMWKLKRLADPKNILSPGVILTEDPESHLKNLQTSPTIETTVDRCIQCGYCEHVCPSRNLTTTPRQRIALRREMARQSESSSVAVRILADFDYDAVQTCAGDGSFMIFPDMHKACAAVKPFVEHGAAAVELLDRASLRSVDGKPGVPNRWKTLPEQAAALLVEFRAPSEPARAASEHAANATLAEQTLLEPAEFTRDPVLAAQFWTVRSGLLASVGGARPSGSSFILEDVCFPPDRLADGALDLQALFAKHSYDGIVFGHASAGNLHFLITPFLNDPNEIAHYDAFMRDVVEEPSYLATTNRETILIVRNRVENSLRNKRERAFRTNNQPTKNLERCLAIEKGFHVIAGRILDAEFFAQTPHKIRIGFNLALDFHQPGGEGGLGIGELPFGVTTSNCR
jgi:ferredoxin